MEERYSAGDETVKPNVVTHTNVIQALKRSQIEDKAETAWDLYDAPPRSTSSSLAAHLLQMCPEEPPSLLIAAANNPSSSENNLSLVWLLSEH
jgi:hypothetical protein